MRVTTWIAAICSLSVILALWLVLLDARWLTWHWGLAVLGWAVIGALSGLLGSRYHARGTP